MGTMVQPCEMSRRASDLRNAPTPFEKILWKHLSRSQLGGYKFRRQHVIGNFIVDFFCPSKGLVIEVDGDTHKIPQDDKRDMTLRAEGFDVLRFTNRDVGANVEGVLEQILSRLQSLPDRWPGPGPTPTPPLKGRGFK